MNEIDIEISKLKNEFSTLLDMRKNIIIIENDMKPGEDIKKYKNELLMRKIRFTHHLIQFLKI